MNFKSLFLLSAALVLAPAMSAVLPGCGGGSSNASGGGQTYNSALSLSPGQIAQFTLNVREGLASGSLVVPTKSAQIRNSALRNSALRNAQAFSFTVPAGSYSLFGSSQSNTFSVSGRFPDLGTFIISGQTPRNSGNGSYSITANGQTATGAFATTSATATPTPN